MIFPHDSDDALLTVQLICLQCLLIKHLIFLFPRSGASIWETYLNDLILVDLFKLFVMTIITRSFVGRHLGSN